MGEAYGETENGCGVELGTEGSTSITAAKFGDDGKLVTDAAGKSVMVQVTPQAHLGTLVWSGDCPNGLAHGLGTLMHRPHLAAMIDNKSECFHGRRLSRSLNAGQAPGAQHLNYLLPGKVHVNIPAWRDAFVPRFGRIGDEATSTRISIMRTAQDAEFTAMNQRAPAPGSDQGAGGAKALYQMAMCVTNQRLELPDRYCQGEPQYATYAPTKASCDSALNGCRALANDGGVSCKPLKLW